ncbi:sulfate/molybdate ABC transporter ATP-binding protein [Pelodictyon luteolum]|uniref:Sulphate transport system permease protein 1 n=1 Tax=Chlorobium luteolum (strain DSM 273 / BCRC 81028 / 2530) TaxID=319225 RepID=Q3B2L9_CHLL3|nr:sulfate ABC transporter ATP-binding protein [Pelodictyon luteolum]ABB24412.1 Sulphate transport system permease protein 1 [Pelodictyon luteolum DSM 273]
MSIEIKNVTKKYPGYTALDDITLKVQTGELIALLGPSGCGKTTLLRIIAGLETPDAGSVLLGDRDTTNLQPREKNVGFVFQHYALFRRLDVFENVAFGLNVRPSGSRPSKSEIRDRVEYLLKLVQMDWAMKRYPSQLSGGQRQRVALARALAVNPKVLLLDEPFSALDAKVRQELRRWLRKLHYDIHVTSIFVTHDQEEALELADRIVVINKGRIEQQGSPQEVYDHPANAFVYNFLGNVNVFHGRVREGKILVGEKLLEAGPASGIHEAFDGQAFIRPHEIGISRIRSSGNDLSGFIRDIRLMGGQIGLALETKAFDQPIEAEITREAWHNLQLSKGDEVFITLDRLKVFSGDYEI